MPLCRGKAVQRQALAPRTARRDRVDIEDAGLGGEAIQLRTSLEAELLSQPGAVGLHRLDAQADPVGDLLIRMTLREQAQHVALSPAQVLWWRGLSGDSGRALRQIGRLREVHES